MVTEELQSPALNIGVALHNLPPSLAPVPVPGGRLGVAGGGAAGGAARPSGGGPAAGAARRGRRGSVNECLTRVSEL